VHICGWRYMHKGQDSQTSRTTVLYTLWRIWIGVRPAKRSERKTSMAHSGPNTKSDPECKLGWKRCLDDKIGNAALECGDMGTAAGGQGIFKPFSAMQRRDGVLSRTVCLKQVPRRRTKSKGSGRRRHE
jgi:hypothetical protein